MTLRVQLYNLYDYYKVVISLRIPLVLEIIGNLLDRLNEQVLRILCEGEIETKKLSVTNAHHPGEPFNKNANQFDRWPEAMKIINTLLIINYLLWRNLLP